MKQTILITGGTGKFGRKYVEHFLAKKWRVLFTTTKVERGIEFINEFNDYDEIDFLALDLSSPGAVSSLLNWLLGKNYHIDHLINNARSLDSLKINESGCTNRKEFMAEYLMDVVVPYELSMALFQNQPAQLKTITNIGSQYGVVAATPSLYDDHIQESPIQYGVAKAALGHLTKELAVRMAKSGVRVNCVAYGGVEGRVDDDFKKRYAVLTPSGRMLTENEIIGPLSLLIDDASSAITGQTLIADGGWSIW